MARNIMGRWSYAGVLVGLIALGGRGCADEVPIDPCPDGEATLPFHTVAWKALYPDGYPPRVYRVDTDGRFTAAEVTDPTNATGTVIASCSDALSTCGADPVGIDELNSALAHPDVRDALQRALTIYGEPYLEPYQTIQITLDDHTLIIHRHCIPRTSFCANDVPRGVLALYHVLTTIEDQRSCTLAGPCADTPILGCAGTARQFYFDTARQTCSASEDYCAGSSRIFESAELCAARCVPTPPPIDPVELDEPPCGPDDDNPDRALTRSTAEPLPVCPALRPLRDNLSIEIVHSTDKVVTQLLVTDNSYYLRSSAGVFRGAKLSTAVWRFPSDPSGSFLASGCRLYFDSWASTLTGGGELTSLSGLSGRLLAIDDHALYTLSSAGIRRTARGGGDAITIVTSATLTDALVRDGRLYWIGDDLLAVATDAADLPRMIVQNTAGGRRVTHNDTHIYFSHQAARQEGSSGIVIRRVPFSGGPAETVVSGLGHHHGPIVAGGFVYWLEEPLVTTGRVTTTMLKRIATDGSTEVEVVEAALPTSYELHADGTHLYWVSNCYQDSELLNPDHETWQPSSHYIVRWPLP